MIVERMPTQNRRSLGSATSSLAAKRHAVSSENVVGGKAKAVPSSQLGKKRPPLSNLTNQSRSSAGKTSIVAPPSNAKTVKAKKWSSTSVNSTTFGAKTLPSSINNTKSSVLAPCRASLRPRRDEALSHAIAVPTPSSVDMSPTRSDGRTVSVDESMSTCDSLKSPEVEYLDAVAVSTFSSVEKKTCDLSEKIESAGNVCRREIFAEAEPEESIIDVDDNFSDPQLCATIACDIYNHLRSSEVKKRPSTDFMEKVQQDINASMRAILVDWLVEVTEEYRLVPDTLYLTINYIDRYLSGNSVNRQRLQLLGVACMMIAAKYEEICAPQVEEFCYITDNTYFKDEVLQMESAVLSYLKFEMTAPTPKCFLRRFIRVAQANNEASPLQLECLANYITELSLLEYSMLQFAPSVVAASAIFLANFILSPKQRPWSTTLRHYTLYEPADLRDCIKALHQLCLNSHSSSLPAIKEKYSQHKYKFVAKKYCPPSIPAECFENLS